MRKGKWIILSLVVLALAYIFYLIVGMSSTYPPIREYEFEVSKEIFYKQLTSRINNSAGWSYQQRDSLKGINDQDCYWISVSYKTNDNNLLYTLKYCSNLKDKKDSGQCLEFYVVSVIDYTKGKDYKTLDDEVGNLLQILDRTVLDGLVPACSER